MSKYEVSIGLCNPKSASNVGGVMRAAGCFSVDRVLYTGKRYDRAIKLNTDTKKINSKIPLIAVDDLFVNVESNLHIVCVDLIEGATPLPTFKHPDNALYLFGPEDGTLSQALIDKADSVVYVPTIGCMNLAASVNVLLYDRLAKQKKHCTNNQLIQQSRDTNNRVKVKNNK